MANDALDKDDVILFEGETWRVTKPCDCGLFSNGPYGCYYVENVRTPSVLDATAGKAWTLISKAKPALICDGVENWE